MGYFSKKDNSLVFTGNGEVVELRPWGKTVLEPVPLFSEDAQRYLHEVAVADGFDLDTYNIVLGGCSLSMHYENMTGKANSYDFHKN